LPLQAATKDPHESAARSWRAAGIHVRPGRKPNAPTRIGHPVRLSEFRRGAKTRGAGGEAQKRINNAIVVVADLAINGPNDSARTHLSGPSAPIDIRNLEPENRGKRVSKKSSPKS